MNYFTPPSIGSKLGEYKPSFLKRLIQFINIWHAALQIIILTHTSFFIGVILFIKPFSPNWASFLLTCFLCLISPIFLILYLKFHFRKISLFRKISSRERSLYLERNGLKINNNFIPFQKRDPYDSKLLDGILSIKLDGNFLLLRTQGVPFVVISHYNLSENEMKFKIDPKFQFCKEELLSYLNSLIHFHQI